MSKGNAKPDYIYNHELVVGGKKVKYSIIDGPNKGLSFFYLEKTDKDFMKISARESLSSKKFDVLIVKGDAKENSTLSLDELMKMVKKDAKLSFIAEYLAKRKPKMSRTKKTSKKTSKKASKKASKKTSKK